MLASHQWLKELTGIDASADEFAERFTQGGLEVEAIQYRGMALDGVVVAQVRSQRPHPNRDQLSLVTVFDGQAEHEVVCGATNVPAPGGRVLFATVGAVLPNGMKMEARKIGGVQSAGMICSEVELDIGAEADGIFVVGDEMDAAPGTPVADALGLADAVLELGLTPNRPDALGHVGLAREACLLFERPFAWPAIKCPATFKSAAFFDKKAPTVDLSTWWDGKAKPAKPTFKPSATLRVDIADPDRCPRYGAALVLGVKVAPSPFALRYRLHCLGLRAISNLVDATNLVLLEYGHPIHGFDLNHVRGSRIEVRLAKAGERMATLDGEERSFTDDDLLICDGQGPVAVAGVMGGADSEIRDDTSAVLIECAYFDPRSIRRTSRRLGLHTDSSHRFERGVDPNGVDRVLARAASLIAELGGGQAGVLAIDNNAKPIAPVSIALRPARMTQLLGYEVPRKTAERVLSGLGCATQRSGAQAVEVSVPSWRPDLTREVDLIEEVARVHGYSQIPAAVPRVRPSSAGAPAKLTFVHRLRGAAAAAGLLESINYSFVDRASLDKARVSTEAVALSNPLSEERAVMRTSLLPGLLAAASNALRRQVHQVRLFELGRTFAPKQNELPEETTTLALLFAGTRPAWIGEVGPFDFYDGKGAVESIVRAVLTSPPEFSMDDTLEGAAPFLHPRRRARVAVAGTTIGMAGELHPDVSDAFELPGRAIYAELDVASLLGAAEAAGVPQAQPLPRYPSVVRDVAILVEDTFAAGEIATALQAAAGGLAEAVTIFDLYQGDQIPRGHRSLAFRIVYRDSEATLTDKRVDKAHAKVLAEAKKRFAAELR